MTVREFRNKKISVLGAARSGIAVARLLASQGGQVLLSDSGAAERFREELQTLSPLGIAVETGGHTNRVFDCSFIVLSPGIPEHAPVVKEAAKRQIPIVSELEAASWFCSAPIIGVTGSNGKTTTTTLIGRILGDAKKKHVVAGNIGTAFSSVVLDVAEADLAVLEVSSFQLDHCESFRPWISVILNITEDHMDRYDHSMERYAASKSRIFANQNEDDILISSADDPWTVKTAPAASCRKLTFSAQRRVDEGAYVDNGMLVTALEGTRTEIIPLQELSLKGTHNAYNAMASTLVGQLSGVSAASIRATLRNFKGVEHRLEFVREYKGIRYFNDSKATNVDSVWYALQAFQEPIVLLLGGRDKGNDYSRLTNLVRTHVKSIVAIGESAATVEQAFRGATKVVRASSMKGAVETAAGLAAAGDVVLLSPACASFDWFENYEHRGRVFKELVSQLP